MFIKGIVILIICRAAFDLLFVLLNKIIPKILSPLQNIPEKWKGSWIIKRIAIFISILICTIFFSYFELSYIISYIIIGFSISLLELAFKKPSKGKSLKP